MSRLPLSRLSAGLVSSRLVPGLILSVLAIVATVRTADAVPSPSTSRIPAHVLAVGRVGALADTATGSFTVVVRNLANNPIVGATVEFRVLNCEGLRLASSALQPGVSVQCGTHGFTATTDIHGEVRMCLVGGGTEGSPPGSGACASVFAAGVLLGNVSVAYPDLDGVQGVAINDLALWLQDLGRGEPISRSDLDGDGVVGVSDLSLWLDIWAAGRSAESAPSYCP